MENVRLIEVNYDPEGLELGMQEGRAQAEEKLNSEVHHELHK